MRMQDHCDRGSRARSGTETAFETALWARKNDFGHLRFGCSLDG
jgi:hypothetical protein